VYHVESYLIFDFKMTKDDLPKKSLKFESRKGFGDCVCAKKEEERI
jgi:hypothetical protein